MAFETVVTATFLKIWLHQVLVVAHGIFDCCGMRNLVPQPGIKVDPLALGAQNLSRWTTREVPATLLKVNMNSVIYISTNYHPQFPLTTIHHPHWSPHL